jgi:hypothetical protein
LLNNLTDTLNRLDMTQGTDYQVITISFDPKDTPPLAAKKRDNPGSDGSTVYDGASLFFGFALFWGGHAGRGLTHSRC